MRLYTFPIAGGSPYDGDIKIISNTKRQAMMLAEYTLKEMNKNAHSRIYLFLDEKIPSQKIDKLPFLVNVESGEN